jgi:SAM-dependent methyltransferase
VEGYDASTYGDRFADVYDDWYADVTDVDACVALVADLAAAGPVGPLLELGVGSGRLAVPLAGRGLEVHGLDASTAMLEALAAKPGGDRVVAIRGDMATPPAGPWSIVLVAFNTFFNLATEGDQRRCLAAVAGVLAPGGRLVLEAFVPADHGPDTESAVTPRQISADEVVLSISRHDRAAQTITGSHVHVTEAGTRLRPWHLRYATPAQLDAMAADAGLVLVDRWAGWREEPFDETSNVHVSVYGGGNVDAVHPGAATIR